jgi:hypothetical protein
MKALMRKSLYKKAAMRMATSNRRHPGKHELQREMTI